MLLKGLSAGGSRKLFLEQLMAATLMLLALGGCHAVPGPGRGWAEGHHGSHYRAEDDSSVSAPPRGSCAPLGAIVCWEGKFEQSPEPGKRAGPCQELSVPCGKSQALRVWPGL